MTDEPDTVQADQAQLPGWVEALRYANLTSFRPDGSPVASPIWFALHEGGLLVRTPTATAKVRRLRADPAVELRPCDWRGRPVAGAVITGTASVLDRAVGIELEAVLRDRYGWQWNVVPMIPLPGVRSAHRGLPLRDRIRRARAEELWAESSLLRIVADPPSPRPGPTPYDPRRAS